MVCSLLCKKPCNREITSQKVKVTRIKSIKERRKYRKRVVAEINRKLEQGWNPFLEQESAKSYHNIYEVFHTYLNVKEKELRAQSMRSYNSNMKILMEYLSENDEDKKMYILSFDKQTANDFMNYMYVDRNVSERKYNGILIFCKSVFGWMIQYGYIKANPFDGIKKKKEKAKKRRDSGIINLLQSGVSPEEVAKQAAHSSLDITSKYAIHANKKANEQVKTKAMPF